MAQITIKQVIELSVDLNSYYNSFSPALRREIDKEVIALASGEARTKVDDVLAVRQARVRGFTARLPPDTLVYYTQRRPRKSSGPVARIVSEVSRRTSNGNQPLLIEDLYDVVTGELRSSGREADRSNALSYTRNLFTDGYVSLEESST